MLQPNQQALSVIWYLSVQCERWQSSRRIITINRMSVGQISLTPELNSFTEWKPTPLKGRCVQGVSHRELPHVMIGNCCVAVRRFLPPFLSAPPSPSKHAVSSTAASNAVFLNVFETLMLSKLHLLPIAENARTKRRTTAARHWGPCYYVWFTLAGSNFLSSCVDNRGPWACSEPCTQREFSDEKVTKQTKQYFGDFGKWKPPRAHLGLSWKLAAVRRQVEYLEERDSTGSVKSFNVKRLLYLDSCVNGCSRECSSQRGNSWSH